MADTPLGFVLLTLAVWRVTHLVIAEDGPGGLIARLRAAAPPDAWWSALLSCFYCLSLWLAAPVAWAASDADWGWRVLLWLAISGGVCLLERTGQPAPPLFYEGNEESNHELLRRSAQRDEPAAQGGATDRADDRI